MPNRELHHVVGHDRNEPAVRLQVRHLKHFVERTETAWPIPDTEWTRLHLDLTHGRLAEMPTDVAVAQGFASTGAGLTLLTAPLVVDTEFTGPLALKLRVSSSTQDADLFAVLRVFSPDLTEVTFQGAIDPHTPVARGWLRASHRKLDPTLSTDYRPYHSHDEIQTLTPGIR